MDVRGVVLRHHEAIAVDLVRNRRDFRLQHAVGEHIEREGEVLRGELRRHLPLRGKRDGDRGLVQILDGERGAGCADEAAGAAHVDRGTDLRADYGELVVVGAINFRGEGKLVFEHHQSFVRDLADV